MFKLLGLVHRVAGLAVICGVAWLGWRHLGPQEPAIAPQRDKAADDVVAKIINDLRDNRGQMRHVALLQFAGDNSGFVTEKLRAKIEFTGLFDLEPKGLMSKVRDLLNLRTPSYSTLDQAVSEGGSLGVEGVIYGNVRRLESIDGEASWDIDVSLCDTDSRRAVMDKTYAEGGLIRNASLSVQGAAVDDPVESFPWLTRILAWVLMVLLLPVFSIAFIRAAVRKKSNRVNAFVLFVYTASDAALGCLLVGAAVQTGFGIAILVGAVIPALVYNIQMLSYGVQLEES